MRLMQPRSELENHMILAQTIRSCCTSTWRATSSIAIYWWATRFAQNVPPTRCSSSLRVSYKRYGKWCFFLPFDLALFASCIFSLLIVFSFGHPLLFDANTRYISTSACEVARKLQICKAQTIIKSQSQQDMVNTKVQSGSQWNGKGERFVKLYLSSTIFTRCCGSSIIPQVIWL